jgi:hypothetical protein
MAQQIKAGAGWAIMFYMKNRMRWADRDSLELTGTRRPVDHDIRVESAGRRSASNRSAPKVPIGQGSREAATYNSVPAASVAPPPSTGFHLPQVYYCFSVRTSLW